MVDFFSSNVAALTLNGLSTGIVDCEFRDPPARLISRHIGLHFRRLVSGMTRYPLNGAARRRELDRIHGLTIRLVAFSRS